MNTKSSKLSLILMHDDGEARSIRISKNGLWLLVILTILSPITGLLGLWVGWEAWSSMSNWQQEKLAYQIQVDELRVQLERFATLEALLKRQDAALGSKVDPSTQKDIQENSITSKKTDTKKITEENTVSSKVVSNPAMQGTSSLTTPKVVSQAPSVMPTSKVQNTSPHTENTSKSLQDAKVEKDPYEKDTAGVKESHQKTSLATTVDHASDNKAKIDALLGKEKSDQASVGKITPINYGVVKVEDVQRQIIQGKRIQAQVGLFNTEKVPQLSGHVQFALVTNDGKKYALSGSNTTFRITRFKSIFIDSELPVSKDIAEKGSLLVEVVSGEKVVFRQLYPLFDK